MQTTTPKLPETEAFLTYFEGEKAKGLVDIKFFNADATQSTSEQFFSEVNVMLSAPTQEDSDFF